MARIRYSGVWGLSSWIGEGDLQVRDPVRGDGQVRYKTDPYAFRTELRPKTASIVACLDHYQWNDQDLLACRAERTARTAHFRL